MREGGLNGRKVEIDWLHASYYPRCLTLIFQELASGRRALAPGHARLHFSQLREDCLIGISMLNLKKRFYVDVGCHHPLRCGCVSTA
jgi:hypothetical protein